MVDVVTLRHQLGLGQRRFARLVGVELRSVRRWESGRSAPTGAALAVMTGIAEKLRRDPDSLRPLRVVFGEALELGGLAALVVRLLDEIAPSHPPYGGGAGTGEA